MIVGPLFIIALSTFIFCSSMPLFICLLGVVFDIDEDSRLGKTLIIILAIFMFIAIISVSCIIPFGLLGV